MRPTELRSLISLIDDPDEGVYLQVKNRLMEIGDEAVPELENAWEKDPYGDLFRERIEDLLQIIHVDGTTRRLIKWRDDGAESLLEGTLIVSRYRYPDLNLKKVERYLETIRRDIWSELDEDLTDFEKVRVFNHIFFNIHGFKKDRKNFHAIPNNYINDVLEQKKGNPLSLGIIYQVIAEDLGLPLRGVNLPNHFILAYLDREELLRGKEEPAFYINPFSEGDVLGRKEINEFLQKLKIEPRPSFYAPCANTDIIRRQLNNLHNVYGKVGDSERVEHLAGFLELFPLEEE